MSAVTMSGVTSEPLAQEFDQLFREHYQLVYRTAYGVTGNVEDAEDVVQTIFLRLVRREFPHDLKKNPKAYLYRAVVNESLNLIRARKRHIVVAGDVEDFEDARSAPTPNAAEEIHKRLYEAVAELSPGAAHILILRYVHNCSDAEIAKLLGTTRGTIAVSLYRSRARLRKLMRVSSFGEKS